MMKVKINFNTNKEENLQAACSLKNKIKLVIPNIITFANLSLGSLALIINVKSNDIGNIFLGSILIILAGILDRYDGKIARKFECESELGKQLDSLSDLVSFGIAPSIICWSLNFSNYASYSLAIPIIFIIAGAYRLAKYNITEFKNIFVGIPITLAGGLIAIDNIINANAILHESFNKIYVAKSLFTILFLSYMMISKVKIPKR